MAINKSDAKKFVGQIEGLFEAIPMGGTVRNLLKNKVMGPVLKDLREFIEESRPPVFYLIGRSGHGKSSLINALAGKEEAAGKKEAPVGGVKPTTPKTFEYRFSFKESYSEWVFFDTRGIFESTRPEGASEEDAVEYLRGDIREKNPDIIMHVISAPEARNLSNDLEVIKKISNDLKKHSGFVAPTIVVINKADTLGNPREWPPERYAKKANLIKEVLDYLTYKVFKLQEKSVSHIDSESPLKGYAISDTPHYVGIIPVCSCKGDEWNIETLAEFIYEKLPNSAVLEFVQAQKRKGLLRKFSRRVINRFAFIAGGIGASPIPISDFIVLTPLQLIMVAIIGGLSCRPLSAETAKEYLKSGGVITTTAILLRTAAQQLIKLLPIPVAAQFISGAIAGGGTYGLGKAAEAYFFSGEIKKPIDFKGDWEKLSKEEGKNMLP